MNLDPILKLFIPKDVSFFPMFMKNSDLVLKASELLKSLMLTEKLEDREPIIIQIKQLEHDGDVLTHEIFTHLNKSFITPFDREDIQSLASSLDDVLDYINGVGQRVQLFKPKKFPAEFLAIAEIIVKAAQEMDSSVRGMAHASKNKDNILESCVRLNKLENRADELYHSGISRLFEFEEDTRELIKHKEIIATLEKAVDAAEDVSDVIKTILVKMV
jgi:predicted phosphate transport protein (TIGR00153 family)